MMVRRAAQTLLLVLLVALWTAVPAFATGSPSPASVTNAAKGAVWSLGRQTRGLQIEE
mgnify:CR=1 FL=1